MAAKIDYQPNDICVLRISGISKRSEFAAKQSTLACKIDVYPSRPANRLQI